MYAAKAPAVKEGLTGANENLKVGSEVTSIHSQRMLLTLVILNRCLYSLTCAKPSQKKGISFNEGGIAVKTNRRAPTREEYLVSLSAHATLSR